MDRECHQIGPRIGPALVRDVASRFALPDEKAREVVAFVLAAARDDVQAMGERLRRTGTDIGVAVVAERLTEAVYRVAGRVRTD